MKMFRQGDVLLVEVKAIPKGAQDVTPKDRIVLAYGEVTGHAHAIYPEPKLLEVGVIDRIRGKEPVPTKEMAIKAKLWDAGAERFLQVLEHTALKHEEHDAIALPVGNYRVVRQREYDPVANRMVAD